jgi:antitoxin component HigA of HigAB toxin-antitoxin module
MQSSKTFIRTPEDYQKALDLFRTLWLNSNNFPTIKAKVALMEMIEEYEFNNFVKNRNFN